MHLLLIAAWQFSKGNYKFGKRHSKGHLMLLYLLNTILYLLKLFENYLNERED